jgi:tetratricopeptide (TPR) repeat protein
MTGITNLILIAVMTVRILLGKFHSDTLKEVSSAEVTPTPIMKPLPTVEPVVSPTHAAGEIFRYGRWLKPNTPDYYFELGFDAWSERKDWQTAAKYYQKSLDLDPNFAPALSSLGYIKGEFMGQFDTGEAMLKKAMELDPSWAYAPFNLGILYDLHGRPSDAKHYMEYTLATYPNHPDIQHFRQMYKSMQEHWKETGQVVP